MSPDTRRAAGRWAVPAVAVAAYFAAFPGDLNSIVTPVERILGLTYSVSPWLYLVLGAAVLVWPFSRRFRGSAEASGPRGGRNGSETPTL